MPFGCPFLQYDGVDIRYDDGFAYVFPGTELEWETKCIEGEWIGGGKHSECFGKVFDLFLCSDRNIGKTFFSDRTLVRNLIWRRRSGLPFWSPFKRTSPLSKGEVLHFIKGLSEAWVYNNSEAKLDLLYSIDHYEYNYIVPQLPLDRIVSGDEINLLESFANEMEYLRFGNHYGVTVFQHVASGSKMILVLNPDWHWYRILKISQGMDVYFAPIVIALGTAMNLISIAVHSRKAFKSTSVGFILICLAVTDSLILTFLYSVTASKSFNMGSHFLNCDLVHDLDWNDDGRTVILNDWCKDLSFFFSFFESFLPQVAAWSLVILTFERLVLVVSPVSGKQLVTRDRVVTAWVLFTVLLIGLNIIPVPLRLKCLNSDVRVYNGPTYLNKYAQCTESFMRIWVWVRACMQSFVPATFMFIANIIIIIKLAKRNKKRRKICNNAKKDNSTTITLLVVSFAFIILTPWNALYNNTDQKFEKATGNYVSEYGIDIRVAPMDAFCSHIGRHLLFLNSAINFLLYCVSGAKFRQEFLDMIKSCKKKPPTHV